MVSALLYVLAGFFSKSFASLYSHIVVINNGATLLLGAVLMAALWPHRHRILEIARSPILLVYAVLVGWLAIRLIPDWNPYGVKKFAQLVVYGTPALLAGYVIARDEATRKLLLAWLSYIGLAAGVYLTYSTLPGGWRYQWIGDATYQLTGVAVGACMIAAAFTKRWWCFALAALGASVTGNLTGPAFGGIAVLCIWAIQRDWTATVKAVIAAAVVFGSFFAYTGRPPVVVAKFVQKIVRVEAYDIAETQRAIEEADLFGSVESSFSAGDTKNFKVVDRMELFQIGAVRFLERPLFGAGYGNANYVYEGYTYPHNILLEIGAETGAVGALFLALLMAVAFWAAFISGGLFSLGYLFLVIIAALVSGYFAPRTLLFGFGLAAGVHAARQAPLPKLL